MRLPRVRFRFRTLLALVACFALACWAWVTYLSPSHRWHRTIRSDNESAARWEAATGAITGRIAGLDRSEAISAFCSAMSDPSYRVRETAAYALSTLRGAEARPVVPYLIMGLKDSSPSVRSRCADSLGPIHGADPDIRQAAVPALVGSLSDTNPDVRIAAGFSLVMMGSGEVAIPAMTAAIRAGRDPTGVAALSLGLSGSRDDAAVAALKQAALNSSNTWVRQASAAALRRLSNSESQTKP